MASLLAKVHRKLSLVTYRRVSAALEGTHTSVFKGRSMDFDDLRAYVPSDDIKDIDWKATARSGQMLIKRYIAVRKNNILFVVDTGRSMAATAPSGESKRDIAVMAVGVLAAVATKHGDLVGLMAGDSQRLHYSPLKEDQAYTESILQYINSNITLDAPESDLARLLDYLRRTIRRKMTLVIISDNLQFAAAQEQLLRRLQAQHELLFVAIQDLDPSDNSWSERNLYDVSQSSALPKYVRHQQPVAAAYQAFIEQQWRRTYHLLERLQISNVRISSEAQVVSKIVRLLEEHKHAKR